MELININNNEVQYEALKGHHNKYIKNNDIHKDSFSFPVRSTLPVQDDDGRPWIHKVIKEVSNSDHTGRTYIVRVIKMGRLIMWKRRHIWSTPEVKRVPQEQIEKEMDDYRTFS